jgi:hypothetical protein
MSSLFCFVTPGSEFPFFVRRFPDSLLAVSSIASHLRQHFQNKNEGNDFYQVGE